MDDRETLILRCPDVVRRTGLSKGSIYRLVGSNLEEKRTMHNVELDELVTTYADRIGRIRARRRLEVLKVRAKFARREEPLWGSFTAGVIAAIETEDGIFTNSYSSETLEQCRIELSDRLGDFDDVKRGHATSESEGAGMANEDARV